MNDHTDMEAELCFSLYIHCIYTALILLALCSAAFFLVLCTSLPHLGLTD